MSSPIQKAKAVVRNAIKKIDPRTVTIVNNSDVESSSITATIGETSREEFTENNIQIVIRYRDYLIDVADYDFGAGPVEPEQGDYVKETIDGTLCYFEVTSKPGQSTARYHDRDRTVWRVHTTERGAPS